MHNIYQQPYSTPVQCQTRIPSPTNPYSQQHAHPPYSHPSTSQGLDDSPRARNHHIPLLLILITKLRPQRAFFFHSPLLHLRTSKHHKYHRTQTLRNHQNTNPRHSFKHVVRARNEVEPISLRNASLSAARAPQVRKCDMCMQIACFSKHKQDQPHDIDIIYNR